MPPPRPRSRRPGLSLVEVLIASAVLAVVLVPMMGMFTLGRRTSVLGERQARATFFAHEVLEQFRVRADHETLTSSRDAPPLRLRNLQPPEGMTHQVSTRTVSRGLTEVTVRVWFDVGKRRKRKVELQTLYSRTPAIQSYRLPGARRSSYRRPTGFGFRRRR